MTYREEKGMNKREKSPARDQVLVRLNPNLKKRLFEVAREKGISTNALILTILNDWFEKYGTPRFKHFNIYPDHITIFDTTIGELVDVYKRGRKLVCKLHGTSSCEHVRFYYTLDKVKALVTKGDLRKEKPFKVNREESIIEAKTT